VRIAIDVSALERTPATGVEKSLLQLLRGLAAQEADHEYLLVAPRRPAALPAPPDARFRAVELAPQGSRWWWRERLVPAFAQRERIDLWHAPVQAIPLLLDRPKVATMHELSWLETKGVGDEGPVLKRRLTALAVSRAADLVVCVSRRTQLNFLALHPGAAARTVTVPHGVDAGFAAAAPDRAGLAARLGLDPAAPYFLVVGRALKRKGLPQAVRAFAAHCAAGGDAELVLAGPRNARLAAAVELAGELGLARRVRTPGYVPEENLPALYAGAAALLVPSESEGFGLPVLEGMAAGVPVVAHRASSLPEVAGAAALLVDFHDAAAAAAAMEAARGPRRAALVAAGRERAAAFPADGPARRLLELWEQVAGGTFAAGGAA
jgi:glycosyltransferase involved in cell wall biosynthesis